MYAGQEFHSKFFIDFDPDVGVISGGSDKTVCHEG